MTRNSCTYIKVSWVLESSAHISNRCFHNTIYLHKKKVYGDNTDIYGFKTPLEDFGFNGENKKALILGAGGVSASSIVALKNLGVVQIILMNRTKQKAENLKTLFKNLNVLEWGNLSEFDVVINATSLGLNKEKINLDFSNVGKNKLFYDVIYNPKETNFLKKGKELGNISENGKLMFVFQAYESFKLWHGIEPEINQDILKLFLHYSHKSHDM